MATAVDKRIAQKDFRKFKNWGNVYIVAKAIQKIFLFFQDKFATN